MVDGDRVRVAWSQAEEMVAFETLAKDLVTSAFGNRSGVTTEKVRPFGRQHDEPLDTRCPGRCQKQRNVYGHKANEMTP
jgi:hypothetical protein